MSMYKITIHKVNPPEGESTYGTEVEIYKQTVVELDIEAVIAVVNSLKKEE